METERIVLLDFQKPPPQKRNILMATPRCLLKLMGQSFTTTVHHATYWRRRRDWDRRDFLSFLFFLFFLSVVIFVAETVWYPGTPPASAPT
ncbi:hypothetical protein FIBSPDRAFT_970740 [Athelia psychrophila]|uniref:Uncharacterized protein n=1 Tax=Athelia psychrophila TaxID=1759441 RepID=A0A167SJ50_9AGAM|nr:hypothetical protein FIBSPDRAFT_970740 [Fibularhizoctonia sp. CBS 109695]